ncbi:hypothetical protein CT151_11090 [Raoultella planticola]|nr:hypothetical protein CT151_11090 [Raoultella planticola]
MLIFASISFLLPPTLTIQPGHLLIQIKNARAYHLMGMLMIFLDFYKLWKTQAFPGCCFCVQNGCGGTFMGWAKKRQYSRESSR